MSTIDYGIDLGTTNSALCRQYDRSNRIIPGPEGELLPSAVHVRADGAIEVGQRARDHLRHEPLDTAIEFKRLMGTTEKKRFPASGRELTPEELSAEVLRALCDRAQAVDGEVPRAAVITVPAMFQLSQCDATRRAAALAGLEHAPLLQEPIAAAIAHAGSGDVREGSWLVYDLGGGTFDISLVRCKEGRLQVIDHDGDNHLGGRDFDRAIARRATERVRESGILGEFKRTDPANEEAFLRLRHEAERVRIALSRAESARFEVAELGPGASIAFDLDRRALEQMLEPLVGRTTILCNKLLARNRVAASDLSGLVLVGGPTQTPCVVRQIHFDVGIEATHEVDPMTIVARGAALFSSTQRLPEMLRRRPRRGAIELQLEYEATTTDPSPLIVGRVAAPIPPPPGMAISVERGDGGFRSAPVPLQPDGTFAIDVRLAPNALNVFQIRAIGRGGVAHPVEPETIKLLHGFSIARPPLSQSLGVMLADNTVHWYLRKGAVLPARQTVTHATTLSLQRGQSGEAVHVPLVQGESARADRNKVIGILHIHADQIARDLPEGSAVEVTLSVDESVQTIGRAYVPALDQWFEEIVRFELEAKPASAVGQALADQKSRMDALAELADELDAAPSTQSDSVREIESLLEEGDRDSIDLADQMVRMMSQDLDEVEDDGRYTRLASELAELRARATALITGNGTRENTGAGDPAERRQLEILVDECQQAQARGDLDLAARRIEDIRTLNTTVATRQPWFWAGYLEYLAKEAVSIGVSALVAPHVHRGRLAITRGEYSAVSQACRDILVMFPSEQQARVESVIRSNVT